MDDKTWLLLLNARLWLTDCRLRLMMDSWEESKHKRDEKGRFAEVEGIRTGTVGTGKGAVEVKLGWGENKPLFLPETSSRRHDSHHEDHARDMGLSMKQWKRKAAELLNAPANEEKYLDWYDTETDTFCRYERRTNYIVFGSSDRTINTFFPLEKSRRKWIMPHEYLEILDKKR